MIPIHIDCKSNQRHCNGAVILKLQYANHPKADFNCYSSTIISPFIKSSSLSSSSFFPFFSFFSFFFRDLLISFLPCRQAALVQALPHPMRIPNLLVVDVWQELSGPSDIGHFEGPKSRTEKFVWLTSHEGKHGNSKNKRENIKRQTKIDSHLFFKGYNDEMAVWTAWFRGK